MVILLAGQPTPLIDVRGIRAFGCKPGGEVIVGKICLERCEGGGQRLEGEDAGKNSEEYPLEGDPSPRDR